MNDNLEFFGNFKNELIERLEKIHHPFGFVRDMSVARAGLSGFLKRFRARNNFEEFFCNGRLPRLVV